MTATILIIEDNEANAELLSINLQDAGFSLLFAEDGATGISIAYRDLPDLILMAMSLPVIDGWEAARILKANRVTRNIPLIALTAHAMSGDRHRCLEAGCDDYESKPLNFPYLLLKIREQLAMGESRALRRTRLRRARHDSRLREQLAQQQETLNSLKGELAALVKKRISSEAFMKRTTNELRQLHVQLAHKDAALKKARQLSMQSASLEQHSQDQQRILHEQKLQLDALQQQLAEQRSELLQLRNQNTQLARQQVLLKAYISKFCEPEEFAEFANQQRGDCCSTTARSQRRSAAHSVP